MRKYPQTYAFVFLLLLSMLMASCSSGQKEELVATRNDTAAAPPEAAPAAVRPPNYGGAVDTINCDVLSGWVWDSANPTEKINVDIFVDTKLIATTPANILRPDLGTLSATPNYAFRLSVPLEFKDSKPHTVNARISGSTHEVMVWDKIQPTFTCKPK